MGQSVVAETLPDATSVTQEINQPLEFLPAALVEKPPNRPFVAIVRSRTELLRWLGEPLGRPQWIQIEGLLEDPDAWSTSGVSQVPLDIVLSDPASEFSGLYRLTDICAMRNVRVTMPATPGFLKAIKLAASLRIPIRILPDQPTPEILTELFEALEFYLHGPMVEAPVEFFHSLLATGCGAGHSSLWMILEQDPAAFLHYDAGGNPELPRSGSLPWANLSSGLFVEDRLKSLVEHGAECATCPWQPSCRGYFKWPDPAYSCHGVKQLFSRIDEAANEIKRDLANGEGQLHLMVRDKK